MVAASTRCRCVLSVAAVHLPQRVHGKRVLLFELGEQVEGSWRAVG
jgi:hypothetical protein